ncbi:ABC-type transport auxiliary lipoprotein family protein [Orbus sturtevantii]|uniref:ABC-type transport auxiliary lipoprotein family protein n=1 Tax=Orbus sturtevantii TaxID=3074109 RepID=UPI00370D24F3
MKKLIIGSLLLLLIGCSSNSPNKVYYQLISDFNSSTDTQQVVSKTIVIEPVSVASYLDTTGILYQSNPIEFSTANNNLWLTPLSNQIEQRVVQDLSALLPGYLVTTTPSSDPAVKIKLFIDGFHGCYTGDAIIKGYWMITDLDNKVTLKHFDFKIRLAEDGYPTLVKALSTGWQNEEIDLIRSTKL